MQGAGGVDVKALADALVRELGSDASAYPGLKKARPTIDAEFDAAIRRWQAGVSIIADGIVGPYCQRLLGLTPAPASFMPPNRAVYKLFPATKPANVSRYLAYVESALAAYKLTDRPMVLAALATIRAETEGFVPIVEGVSRFNTAPGGVPFALYDGKLGNRKGEGALFKGRGFVQLTGRNNYAKYGEKIGIDLTAKPDLANTPEIAALLLAAFLDDCADRCRTALAAGDLAAARKLVNGGAHGLDRFSSVFDLAATVWPAPVRGAGRAKAKATATSTQSKRQTGTRKDPFDARDRLYMPLPQSLPAEHPTRAQIAELLPRYSGAGLILDQGQEGACTGFGLAGVVNYLRWVGSGFPKRLESVSPRMLYILARRYDEYQGEDYEGSSCRGALKGWYRNGVCLRSDWPDGDAAARAARYGFAQRAAETPLGIYYRVDYTSITDMQAAIAQHGAIYVASYTHDGWDHVPETKAKIKGHADLPRIAWDGKPSRDGGHAFALVGFNRDGFVIQNSWGKDFGAGGFAVIGYADWLTHGMDAWVVALGVPGVIAGNLTAAQPGQSKAAGAQQRAGWWDQSLAYQHSVVLGNDGRVARYLTEDEAPRKLQHQCFALPDAWFRTRPADEPKRMVLYVHGGLNSESDAIDRAAAMGRYFTGNGCYPIFMVWKTGLLESLQQIIQDKRQQPGMAGGVAEWFSDKTDLLIEKTIGRPLAKPIWSEMKGNAELAFAPRHGGDLLMEALETLGATWGDQFELHVAGHSAGSIWLGYLLNALAARGKLAPTSIELLAPACSVAFANTHYANAPGRLKQIRLHVLGNQAELDDNVAVIYRKSLLYFVSNALETDLRTPLMGLHLIEDEHYDKWDGSSDTRETLSNWRRAAEDAGLDGRTHIVDGPVTVARPAGAAAVTAKASHGNIDNDVDAISLLIQRMTGLAQLVVPVDDLRGA